MKEMIIDELVKGSVDVHCHTYPEFNMGHGKRMDDFEEMKLCAQAGMKGVVLKGHMFPTIGKVYEMKRQVEGIEIYSSIAMNTSSGGLSPLILQSALEQGVKAVWLPTWSARNDIQNGGFSSIMKGILPAANSLKPEDGICLFDEKGALRKEVKEIIALVKDYDVALFTGHVSPAEALAVAYEAKDQGFKRLMFTHPDSKMISGTMEQFKIFADLGFFIETTILGMLPGFFRMPAKELVYRIHEIGAEHWVMSTDSFFEWAPPVCEMMRICVGTLLSAGATYEEVDLVCRKNPDYLING